MYETLSEIDGIRLNFSDGGLLYMNITLAATFLTPINFAFWGVMYTRYYEKAGHLNIPIEIDFLQMAKQYSSCSGCL